jgi:PAT family beta-lactamase induction signal transducer AmpG
MPMYLIGAAFLLLMAPIILRAPKTELVASERRLVFRPLLYWLSRPASVPTLAFILLYKLGDQAISPMLEVFWRDSGMTLDQIAFISNTLGVVATIIGALTGGFLTTKIGLIPSLIGMGATQVISNLVYTVVAFTGGGKWPIYFAGTFESFTQGLGTAAFLALLMALCDKEHAGTQYALLSALFALTRDLSGAASGWATDLLGYGPFFLYTAFLSLPAFALLPWVKRRLAAAGRA